MKVYYKPISFKTQSPHLARSPAAIGHLKFRTPVQPFRSFLAGRNNEVVAYNYQDDIIRYVPRAEQVSIIQPNDCSEWNKPYSKGVFTFVREWTDVNTGSVKNSDATHHGL